MKSDISGLALIVGGLGMGALTAPAGAQQVSLPADTQAEPANQSNDIIVTARRREERLQDVPVAVTAISSAELQQRGTRDITDLGAIAPNLYVGQGGRGGSVAVVNIRGQENTGTAITNDPAVGIYFDEVYLGRSAGSLLASVQDMANVQVLRGPQGTLFGRNNTGGAILLTPNRPNLTDLQGSVNLTYGRFDRFDAGAVVDVPIVKDKLGVRASFLRSRQDGYGKSLTTGFDDYGNAHNDSGRVAIRWKPSDAVTFDFTYDRTRLREAGPALHPLGLSAATVLIPVGVGYYDNRSGLIPFSRADIKGYTFRSEVEINPDMAMKVIIGRRLLSTVADVDVDGGPAGTSANPVGGTDSRQFASQGQWTAEVQLSGTALRDVSSWLTSVNYTAGFFFFYENGSDGSQVPADAVPLVVGRYAENRATNRSTAGYLQLETNTNDKLFLTFGTRYTKDNRELTIRGVQNGACSLQALPRGTPISVCFQSGRAAFDYVAFAAGARYQFNRDLNVYFKFDKAQRAGGLDDSPTTIDPFQPEVVKSYELGAKADLFDRRLRANVAVFASTIDNVQRTSLLVANGQPYSSVFNAAKAATKGVELEVTVRPVDGLTFGGTLGYIDAYYKRFVDPRPSSPAFIYNGQVLLPAVVHGTDLKNLDFPSTSKWTYSLTGSYEAKLGEFGALTFRGDYSYRSRVFFDPFNTPGIEQKAVGLLNGRIQLDVAKPLFGNQFSVALFGRNLTNRQYRTFATAAAGGFAYAGAPRTYGVELRAGF